MRLRLSGPPAENDAGCPVVRYDWHGGGRLAREICIGNCQTHLDGSTVNESRKPGNIKIRTQTSVK
jgi:hypothetical protein